MWWRKKSSAKTFLDLLRSAGREPFDLQMAAQGRFPQVAEARHLHVWAKDQEFSHTGVRVLVGVAIYSEHDLRLLDRLAEDSRLVSNAHVDVFDVSRIATAEEFEAYLPGIGLVCQTPVMGIWHDGQLIERAQGAEVSRKLRELTCRS